MLGVETALGNASIDLFLKELIKIRASQMNGCTFCIDMHVKTARKAGEREMRLHHVAVWRESNLFSDRERIALEITEALTKMTPQGLSDDLYNRARSVFSDKELAEVMFSIAQINAWNRLGVAFHTPIGPMDKVMGPDTVEL
ncbi:carboxymuconolactone decarboxylase family protein [Neisseria chenwenguii]|uniref:carboxymuconolactone decarboxylase family protein n=1 Tax=Neisseria chenwenguii TaxID=1853278 RepID=UPI0018DF9178|nr:carboxymuconolactone decarboxylase family protein [Neisseria chenwenguii]